MDWTEANLEKLKTLWECGTTTSKIADALGTTKSSVVGKAHRLGLPARPSPIATHAENIEANRAKTAEAERLLNEGYNASSIARSLRMDSTTVAKLRDKLGLPLFAGSNKPVPRVGSNIVNSSRVTAIHAKKAEKPRIVAPPPLPPTPKAPRAKECCWPIGEPGKRNFRYCDSPDVVGGSPYCEEHHRLAYVARAA